MCCFKKKKKCISPTAPNTGNGPARSRRNVNPSKRSQPPPPSLGRKQSNSKDTTRTSRPKVGAIHKKMNPNAIGAPKDTETKKKQMEEAMQMLGCSMVNTEIIQRLEKDSKQNKDGGGKAQMSSRQGDIAFSLQKKPNRKPKDDDTLYPLNEKPENANNRIPGDAESTEVQEDLEEEPNSENYMWNTREIHYTCVDMIRNIDKNVITEATGIDEEGGDPQKIQWDPFAPLNVLQNRLVFDCQTLRKNTLISTALSYPDKNEKKAAMSKSKAASAMKKVKINEKARELTKIRHDNNSIRTTQMTALTNSLDGTPQSSNKK